MSKDVTSEAIEVLVFDLHRVHTICKNLSDTKDINLSLEDSIIIQELLIELEKKAVLIASHTKKWKNKVGNDIVKKRKESHKKTLEDDPYSRELDKKIDFLYKAALVANKEASASKPTKEKGKKQ